MEGVTKDSGHRASVSMPSLDANDDFPTPSTSTANTEGTDSVFVTTDGTLASTTSTETLSSSGHTDILTTDTVSFSSVDTVSGETEQPIQTQPLTEKGSLENIINEATIEADLIDESPTLTLVDDTSTEPSAERPLTEHLIDEASTEQLIGTVSTDLSSDEVPSEVGIEGTNTEPLVDVPCTEALLSGTSEELQQEDILDDSQGEEDPSIAIDQFIKKIADEQLSSKRIEERKEEEAKEQVQEAGSGSGQSGDLENTMLEGEDNTQNVASELSAEPSSLENTLTEEKDKEVESMEVDSDMPSAPAKQFNIVESKAGDISSTEDMESEDHMQMESIEEIQKEINKIPPKKSTNEEREKTQEATGQNGALEDNNQSQTQKSIEQMLEEDLGATTAPSGEILKSALKNSFNEPSIEDSSDVARDQLLIEKAQDELKKLDVLVCGECHNTFYFTQDFMDHKKGKCPKKSILSGVCENESKPQVWGFILWKIKQTKDMGGSILPSSWSIYQRWCKLPLADKSAWITAGQAIQFASKIGNARVTEVRPTRQTKQVIVHKVIDKELPTQPIEFVDSNKENSSGMDVENTATNIIKRGISKPVKLNNDVTILPSMKNAAATSSEPSNSNKALRSTKVLSMQKEEYVVEKIMAKRFNPRKKTWEFNIKWENFGHDSNTWEPIGNLSHCKSMLDQFEEQLKRMKDEKAKQAAQSPKGRGRPSNPKPTKPNSSNYVPIAPKIDATPRISNVVGGVSDDYAGGSGASGSRPTRSSKQNALSQLKQWCGNVSDEDSGGAGLKRKHESDDSDEDFDDKKIKLEDGDGDSDYSDKEIKPKISIKKVTSTIRQTPVKNGNTGPQQILPSNILIPDANGVVRINQKQLPSLSSGVYIMSKTAGIIKLDSTTSKVATSGGQTIVKVAPKIGQTQIKIVKKDGNTTKQIIQVSPKPIVTATPVRVNPAKITSNKFTPKIRREVKKPVVVSESISKIMTPVHKKVEAPPTPTPAPQDEESDDGLEPLPFPGPDEPIPDLEDNPEEDDFVLDPNTGKIAGIEYVDKPVVIKEEPQPVPPSTNDLENIVKLAAAEITESDSQTSDNQMELDPLFTDDDAEVKPTIVHTVRAEQRQSTPGVVRKVVKYTTAQAGASRAVISPMRGSTPVQIPRPRVVQQKVINQMVSRAPPGGPTRTVVRHVIGPQRTAGGNVNVIRKTIAPAPKPRFNLTPQKPLPSPLQPTRTYSAMGGIRQQNAGPGSKVQVYSTKSTPVSHASAAQEGIRRIGNTIVRTTSSGHMNTPRKQQPTQYTPQKQPVTRIVQRVVTSPRKQESQNVVTRTVAPAHSRVVATARPKPIISMPSLTDEDGLAVAPPKLVQKPAQPTPQPPPKAVPQLAKPAVKAVVKPEPPVKVEEAAAEDPAQSEDSAANSEQGTDWSSFTMADGDNPIYVTGDDGTIYQVAGQNEQGQTILITQGPDGQQQCLLVTNEIGEMTSDEQPSTSTAGENADAESADSEEATLTAEEQTAETSETTATSVADSLQTPLHIKTDNSEMEGIEEGVQDQVVAQVVRAEPPSPGGTHKVVVMLPDGNLMVTQVSPEEYASLELE